MDSQTNVEIDIMINKVVEVYNSFLLSTYAMVSDHFRNMVLLIKQWNKNKFNNPGQRLNSYSLALMVLAFLMKFKMVPNLQSMAANKVIIK